MACKRGFLKTCTRTQKTKLYEVWVKNNVHIYVIRKRASKRSVLTLQNDGSIKWEQFYPFGGMSSPYRVTEFYIKIPQTKGVVTIVLLRGIPQLLKNLDDGVFVSVPKELKDDRILCLRGDMYGKLSEIL